MRISDVSSDVCSSDLPEYTVMGPGLVINRFGGIYVNGDAVIGANANLTHGSMLGQVNRGERAGSPILGDRIFVGAGATILGRLYLGDGCAVGANAVVTKDVPEHGVVGGIRAKLLSEAGSEGDLDRKRVGSGKVGDDRVVLGGGRVLT